MTPQPVETKGHVRSTVVVEHATHDERDMRRLGKRQELRRRFRFASIVSYVAILGLTWEFSLVTGVFSLANGGTAGAIWLTLVVCFGMLMCVLSMAELASMAPTSGGQYHWVSEFAPSSAQKPLSYAVGWLCTLGWQSAMPTVAYIGAQQVLALIAVCSPSYAIQGWHGAILTIAFVLTAISFNTFAISKLPILKGLAVALHFTGFLIFLAILWTLGPKTNTSTTFTGFADTNAGAVEELSDASHVLPRAMVCAATVNYITGFAMTVTLMSNLGDLDADLMSRTGQPWVAVIRSVTGSRVATIVLLIVMIFMYFFCAVNQVTTSARQIFAFARDRGLPFSGFLARVDPNTGVPTNSIYVTLLFTSLLALIIIGSTTAFNIILSVSATGLFTSYIVVIATVLLKRLRGEKFPAFKFRLGYLWGVVVNVSALCFLTIAFLFLFFPAVPNPDPQSMNWAILIYGGVVCFAGGYYWRYGREEYTGPVKDVKWQEGEDI